ncbi:MAG: hypothetical protein Kow0099_07160 [Candidatus Abyssubacteria bacterium]
MNAQVILGIAVGIFIGAMDFSLARSIAALIRPSNAHAGQTVILAGFIIRLGLIGFLLWTLSRADDINFLAVCVGLTGSFTVLTVKHSLKSLYAGRARRQLADRR